MELIQGFIISPGVTVGESYKARSPALHVPSKASNIAILFNYEFPSPILGNSIKVQELNFPYNQGQRFFLIPLYSLTYPHGEPKGLQQ